MFPQGLSNIAEILSVALVLGTAMDRIAKCYKWILRDPSENRRNRAYSNRDHMREEF